MADNVLRILLAATAATLVARGTGGRTTDSAEPPRGTEVAGAAAPGTSGGLAGGATMSVTGCLRRGNQAGTYLLRLSKGSDAVPPTPRTAASATVIAPADWSGARAFLVAASAGNDLSAYNDAEVEVTGIVQRLSLAAKDPERAEAERPHGNPNASGAATAGGVRAGDTAGTDATKGDMPALFRTIQAERVRRIADHCEDADRLPALQRP